jgi:DNA-directed RNA polymerase specialized sigma54-like protein
LTRLASGHAALKECLTLQLKQPAARPPKAQLALMAVVANHLDHLAAHDFLAHQKINLRCSDD